jgi:hypothetical protein
VGIGETYPRNEAEASLVHSSVAGMLLGRDSRDIERIWADFYRTFDFQITGGAEMRVLSAIDLALWDLLGKSLNVPAYRLLGGKSNPEIRLYNTCFGHRYDFNKEPEKIMHELIDRYGIKAIKIWPFDGAALRNQHEYVTMADIDEGLGPVRKLRDTFGNDIEILMEFRLLNAPTYGQPAGMKATKREISIAQGMYNVRQGKLLCRKKGIRTYEDHTLFPQKIPGCNGRIGWIVASSPCFVFGPLSSRRPGCRGDVS